MISAPSSDRLQLPFSQTDRVFGVLIVKIEPTFRDRNIGAALPFMETKAFCTDADTVFFKNNEAVFP